MANYRFAFDLPLADKVKNDVPKIMWSNEKLEIVTYIPPALPATKQVVENTTKSNKEFIQKPLVIRVKKMKAEDEIADQKKNK